MYIKRTIEQWIIKNAKSFPSITIYGPRQVGKSTTADELFGKKFKSVNLDKLEDRSLAIENPALFLNVHGWPLIINEVQKAPKLLEEIKDKIDEQRNLWRKNNQKPELMYILTGSNRFELTKFVSESLAGRTGLIEMSYLDQREILNQNENLFCNDIKVLFAREKEAKTPYRNVNKIFNDIYRGFMPDVVKGDSDRDVYYPSYVNTYIEKDIRTIVKAENETRFRDFMKILAFRTGQQIIYSDIASLIGVDTNTVKSWLSLLVNSGIIILLEPYMAKISRRINKAPKLYFLDTGLASYLCGWPSGEMIKNGAMSGAFFETYCVAEIVKNLRNYGKRIEECLFYYRDMDQKEIDLLYVDGNNIFPMEIKKTYHRTNINKNWDVLKKYNMNILPGLVIENSDSIRAINETVYSFPAYLLGL